MRRRFVQLNVVALAAAVVVRSCDAAYHWLRTALSVLPDSLLHYNMLLTWWRHGDSPRGYTLTPAPYFIDMAWATGVLGATAAVLIATARGPLTISDPASYTSRAIGCFADADRAGLLQDGLATVWLARYLNAARLAHGWASPHVLVEIRTTEGAVLHPQENNAVWFSSGYRAGRAKLNFLITHGLSDEALRAWRDRMGPPDRTITCPEDHDLGIDGKAAFEVWIWDRDDAQARLAEIVTHHNLRGAFAPVVGASALPIDVAWGMTTAPGDGALVGRRRVWRRGDHRDQATLATSYEVYAPGGRYRVDVELDAVPRAAASGPVAELVVETDRAPDQRFAIAAGTHRATFEVVIRNPGAATSGNATRLSIAVRDADSLDLSGVTLTPLALDSIAPFEIFR